MRPSRYKTFAWRGVVLQIPSDWDMAVDGVVGEEGGYIRIDDAVRPRLEIRWERVPFEKAKPPEEVAKRYLSDLRKRLEKKAKAIAKARKLKKVEVPEVKVLSKERLKVRGHDALVMHLRGPEEALYATWYCEHSERHYSVQLSFRSDEYAVQRAVFKRVIDTFECHGEGDTQMWVVYGITMQVPRDLELTSRRLTTGFSYIVLASKKRDRYVVLSYSSMANVLLEEYYDSLEEWYRALPLKRVISQICKVKPKVAGKLKVGPHEALLLKASTTHILKSRKMYLSSAVWHCPESNRIVCLTVVVRGADGEGFLASLGERLRCH